MLGTENRAENKAVMSMPFWNVYASRARESPAQFITLAVLACGISSFFVAGPS